MVRDHHGHKIVFGHAVHGGGAHTSVHHHHRVVHELAEGLCRTGDERRRGGLTRSHLMLITVLGPGRKTTEHDHHRQHTADDRWKVAANRRLAHTNWSSVAQSVVPCSANGY